MEHAATAPTGSRVEPRHPDAVASGTASDVAPARLTSLDVFRGFTMLFMASEIMRIPQVARTFTESAPAQWLAWSLDHVPWVGGSPWDMIQPAFMFMVGVSLPFSLASRRAKGHSFRSMLVHAVYRALVLIALGIYLRSNGRPQTYFTFEDVLTQIGLGYVFLFLIANLRPAAQWLSAGLILVGYWAAFAVFPLPPAGFNTASVGVPADWPHQLSGFAAHWNKNTNFAAWFDQWFLNLFPREEPFVFNRGGYLTLNFIPSLATMIFGLLAGGLLRSGRSASEKLRMLLAFGGLGILLGLTLHALGVVPLVKRIWTPSWAIFSAGWAVLFLALFYYVIDLRGHRRWAFPFLVVGMNSIAIYVLVHETTGYITDTLRTHLGSAPFELFGPAFAPITTGAAALLLLWLTLYWMYRRRIFLRI
jgi:heparan-alpha-glucosaminide N-acetyltransferase